MENKYFISECMLVPTEGSSLKDNFEISGGNPNITYYESVKSPAISLSLNFIDVDQVISREGITGGEYLSLRIKVDGYEDFEIKPDKHFLMLNSVKDVQTTAGKQVATLEFLSVESIINETSRMSKKFTGNISQIVFELLIGDKKGVQTSKNLDNTDRTINSYSFVGNFKRPFDTIQWLCSKSQSKDGSGFLFFETLDGYVFKSIENLLKEDAIDYKKSETSTQERDDFRIIENNLNQTNDIGMNCRLGMYANKTIYVNLDNATLKTVDFKHEDLKLKKSPKLPNQLETFPTRLMLRVLDKGALQKGSKRKEIQRENELAIYQNKSYARTNSIFSQSMSISIPFNPELRAGRMLNLRFPLRQEGGEQDRTLYGTESTNDPSGKYLIAELKHIIADNKANTQLKLIRDVFTA